MRYLCIDTSNGASVSIVDYDGENLNVLSHSFINDSNLHAEKLSVLLKKVVQESKAESIFDLNIESVVCGVGPAPFTGLRAGLVTARTVAYALSIPILGVCSLDVLALQGFDAYFSEYKDNNLNVKTVNNNEKEQFGELFPEKIVVVTDAKRKEIYYGLYELNGKDDVRLLEEVGVDFPEKVYSKIYGSFLEDLGDITDLGKSDTTIKNVGNACSKYSDYFGTDSFAPTVVNSTVMARIAYSRSSNGINMNNIEPKYLRRPDVQEPKTNKK